MAQEQFGEEGIPKEITFSEIEEIGHQVGQLAAGTVDQTLQVRHAEHLGDVELVPGVVVFAQFSSDSGRSKLATVQSTSTNRFVIVTTVSVIFFPQRPLLKLDGRAYIPAVLE